MCYVLGAQHSYRRIELQYLLHRNNIETLPKCRNIIESSQFCQFAPLVTNLISFEFLILLLNKQLVFGNL